MFWENFIEICKKRGLKPTPVIKGAGLASSSIARWQAGSAPNGDSLINLAKYLDCSIDFLLTGHDYISNNADKTVSENKLDIPDQREKELIEKYRLLPEDLQNKTLGYIDGMLALLPSTNSDAEKRLSS